MKVSLKWLRDYVNIDLPAKDLAHRLTMAGIEVGSLETIGGEWDNIFVGQVVAVGPHPNADRLKLATVEVGGERSTVVCGAPNITAGQRVPFARVGARLIDGHSGKLVELKPATIRGVKSAGMVCSEKELGLSDQHEGIMVLPDDAPVGTPLADYVGDVVLDIKLTPNRPDCLSVLGVAREVAALTGQGVRLPDSSYEESAEPIVDCVSVQIDDPDLCPRYCASLVRGVKVGPSPAWMQERILAAGMRPINNIVDITNYVMLEVGQPLHAFDYELVGDRRIIVRRAREKESLLTLDGKQRDLGPETLVIADGLGAVAVAGIMGGASSEVSDATTTILLEAANFNNVSIRRTSGSLNMRSEASIRFDKGLSPDLAPLGLRRATKLMIELAGGQAAAGIVDCYPGRREPEPIVLRTERLARILGLAVPADRVVEVLGLLGFACRRSEGSEILVTPPYWRTDVRLEDDLAEEVGRIIGYDDIPTTTIAGEVPHKAPAPLLGLKDTVRDILVGCGLQEIITYSLVSGAALERLDPEAGPGSRLRLSNPMSQEQEFLRTTLRAGLLQTLTTNEKHEEARLRFFELGRVYLPRDNDLPEEPEMVAGVLAGPRTGRSWLAEEGTLDFFDAKGIVETLCARLGIEAVFRPGEALALLPGRAAEVVSGGQKLGVVGEVHPRIAAAWDISARPVVLFELDLGKLLAVSAAVTGFQPLPRFPGLRRDLAVVVSAACPAQEVEAIIRRSGLVRQVTLFDVYQGPQIPTGQKSLAFSVWYQSPSRTLTDREVDQAQEETLERLRRELGATLRA